MHRFVVVGLIAVLTLGLADGTPAQAATTCSFGNGVMTVTSTSYEMLRIGTTAYLGGPPLLSVVTGGWYKGPPAQTIPCGNPGINDVTRIDVSTAAGTPLTIDQRGGALQHSGFPLGDGQRIKVYVDTTYSPNSSSSLIVYGTDGNDRIVAGDEYADDPPTGRTLIDLDANGDADVVELDPNVFSLYIDGAGGNDEISGAGAPWLGTGAPADIARIDGGAGDDDLTEGRPPLRWLWGGCVGRVYTELFGGAGDDRLHARRVSGCQSDANSTFFGGPGFDTVDYSAYATPLDLDLDGVEDDGVAGGPDWIWADVEGIVGGAAGDTILGSVGANLLDGGPGQDYIESLAGDDTILVRDADRDFVLCGSDMDAIRLDPQLDWTANCEVVLP
jgi:hypothetical protein